MVKTIVTLESVNDKLIFHEKLVTDFSFSKHTKRLIGTHIKGAYHKQLSSTLKKPLHLYSPQKLLQTLQQTKLLPKLRCSLRTVLSTVTDLEAAKQMVKVFTDPIKPEEVVEKMSRI